MSSAHETENGLLTLWALPRSRSTAFFRMMVQRHDSVCIHEPFCTLKDTGSVALSDLRGQTYVLNSIAEVIKFIVELSAARRVFVKETTEYDYADLLGSPLFSPPVKTALLVRAPTEVVASHLKMLPDLPVEKLGYGHLLKIGRFLRSRAIDFHLMHAARLNGDPRSVCIDYCGFAGLRFIESALQWSPGHREEWSRTTRWHEGVATSSRLGGAAHVVEALDSSLSGRYEELCRAVQVDYESLLRLAGSARCDSAASC